MADEEAGGLLAILGEPKGKKAKGDEPDSAKARAVKAMYEAMKSGDWDMAADEFATAYKECASEGEDYEDEEE